jgi:hypothetical protein
VKPDDRIAVLEEQLAGMRDELRQFRQLAEKAIPEFQMDAFERELKQSLERMRAVAAMPRPERIEALRKMTPKELSVFWTHSQQQIDETITMLRAVDLKTRTDLIQSMPPGLRDEIAEVTANVPPMIEAKLAPHSGISVLEASHVPSERKDDKYEGVRFDKGIAHRERRDVWERRLQIDDNLAAHVANGTVVVRDMTEREARHEMELRWADKPERRPRLKGESL